MTVLSKKPKLKIYKDWEIESPLYALFLSGKERINWRLNDINNNELAIIKFYQDFYQNRYIVEFNPELISDFDENSFKSLKIAQTKVENILYCLGYKKLPPKLNNLL